MDGARKLKPLQVPRYKFVVNGPQAGYKHFCKINAALSFFNLHRKKRIEVHLNIDQLGWWYEPYRLVIMSCERAGMVREVRRRLPDKSLLLYISMYYENSSKGITLRRKVV